MARWEEAPLAEAEGSGSGQAPKWASAPIESPAPANRPMTLSEGSQSLVQSDQDFNLALKQGVNPNSTSKYFPTAPQRLGDLEEFEWGQGYKLGGEEKFINPKTDFVARDPDTGKMAVYARNKDTNEGTVTTMARAVVPSLVTGPIAGIQRATGAAGAVGTLGTETAGAIATQRAAEIARDAKAFTDQGVRPVGPAFNQGPIASIGKQLSETPIIGAPIRNSLDEAFTGAGQAVSRVADRMAPNATAEQTGLALQRGLDRYRTAGVKQIEPEVVESLGVTSRSAVQPSDVMSKGAAQRLTQAEDIRNAAGETATAVTSRGVQVPAARSRDQTVIARRGAEDLSDSELHALVRAPSQDTSFAARQEALYEQAWRQVPARFKVNEANNANLVRPVNTQQAFGAIESAAARSGVNGTIGQLQGIADRAKTNVTLPALREMRTVVGRALGNFGLYETSLDRSQLKNIYGALSRDIEVAVQDMANRARIQSKVSPNRPDYVSPQVAKQAEGALYALRRADRYTRMGVERMDNFAKIVGTENPQQAIGTLVRSALDGTKGNIQMLRTARAALRDEEWGQLSSLVLRELGKPTGSARGIVQETGFSPSSFVTRWQNMAPEARKLLLGGEHAKDIDDLFRINSRLANIEAQTNFSRSGTNALNLGGAAWVVQTAIAGEPLSALGVVGGGAALSVILSRPAYVKWASGYAQARAAALRAPADTAVPRMLSHINKLEIMAQKDPALLPILRAVAEENGIEQRGDRNQ
jgi:hypothetical protein